MKKIGIIILVAFTAQINAQTFNIQEVSGKIIVESSDIGGITVFNKSSNNGTITDDNGEFVIKIAFIC